MKKEYDKDAAIDEARYLIEKGYYIGELDEEELAKKIFKERKKEKNITHPDALVPKI